MTPEGKVKAKVNAMVKSFGNQIWKFMPVQMGMGLPALDYLLCVRQPPPLKGVFFAIETKVSGKRPTPRQELTIANIRAAGGVVFVVDDDLSLAECRAEIERILVGS